MKEKKLIFFLICLGTGLVLVSSEDSTGLSRKNKNLACGKNMWSCKDGQCIDSLRRCDEHFDCKDMSDEDNCASVYCDEDSHYFCSSKQCISREQVCDGGIDCSNEEDEEHCKDGKPCHQFQCENDRCIPLTWKCDGQKDCINGSDERNCSDTCPEGYAPCKDNRCLPKYLFCNGNGDCDEGEDEEHCAESVTCTANHSLFLCKDGSKCLKMEWLCDGFHHCNDGSDEGGRCSESCNSSELHCEHECFVTPYGPKCICQKGYILKDQTCKDIDECESESQVCDHFCKNTNGNFSCSCAEGYQLLRDEATCRIEEPALLLFSVGNSVKAKQLDNTFTWVIWNGKFKISGVAYDPLKDKVYWVSHGKEILFKSLRGREDANVFINKGFEEAENLAIDWYGRNLYVTDYKKGYIQACNLETASCLPILKNLSSPRAIQIDLENRHLYWTTLKSKKIERSRLDGTFKTEIVKSGLAMPNGLAIDHPASRMYWVDAQLDQIDSCYLNGTNRKSLPNKDASHSYSLAIWQDRIYWTEWQRSLRREIHSCRKRDGQHWKHEYKDDTNAVNNLAIYHESMFQNIVNPCNHVRLKCSDLCFATNAHDYTCACPEESVLASDEHTCKEKNEMPLVVMQSKLYGVLLRRYGKSKLLLKNFSKLNIGVVADMDYNPMKNTIVFADPKNEVISAFSLGERDGYYKIIENVKQPISVAVDWLRRNLYWINGYHRTVEVATLSGYHRLSIIKYLRNPTDLALDVVEGHLYVSDTGVSSSIMKCQLNGVDCVVVVRTNIDKPSSISLDLTVTPKQIYWTDCNKNQIESVDVSGKNRSTIFKKLKNPVKLYVSDKNILWTERRSAVIYVASKNTHEDVEKISLDLTDIPSDEWFMALTMCTLKPADTKNPCTDKCDHLCFSRQKKKVCGCAQGFKLGEDGSTCEKAECESSHKKCEDGECTPAFVWCDGTADCSDGSDEKNCTPRECTHEQYKCKSGQCIDLKYKCDNTPDCVDNSDEDPSFCKNACGKFEDWKCQSGECIPRDWRCNNRKDCVDGSDEENCDKNTCKSSERRCEDGWCIPLTWWCDGNKDCKDGEDESKCPCKLGEYKCKNGLCLDERKICRGEISCGINETLNLTCSSELLQKTNLSEICPINFISCQAETSPKPQCIPFEAWCNGTKECREGEDENNCIEVCPANEVKCKGQNTCIEKSWICDLTPDCLDGSDEEGCSLSEPSQTSTPFTLTTCSSNEFECPDGQCISLARVCDGMRDCLSGVDEDESCDKCKTNNGGCDHFCTKHPIKVICSCRGGYKLASDGYSCLDVDECEDENVCEQDCENTRGNFICRCRNGYALMEDAFTCKAIDGSRWTVALLHGKDIQYLDEKLDHLNEDKVPPYVDEILYDPTSKNLIALNRKDGFLHKRLPVGWSTEKVVGNIITTSLDYINRNIYFVKAMIYRSKRSSRDKFIGSTVKVYNLESKYLGNLFSVHGKRITAIEILFFTREIITCENEDTKGSIIGRNMDGTNSRVLVDEKIKNCESLAIDEIRKKIYWLDTYLNRIESVGILGYDRKRFVSDKISYATGLALLNRDLLWFNSKQLALWKCRNSTVCLEAPYSVKISHIVIPPFFDMSVRTPCSNSTCQHICVPHTLDVQQCVCAEGFRSVNKECVMDGSSEKFRGNCSENLCNKGDCISVYSGYVECRCPKGYRGRYCEVSVQKTTGSSSTILIIFMVLIILALGLGLLLFCKKYPYKVWNRSSPYISFRFMRSNFELMKEENTGTSTPPIPRSNITDSTGEKQFSRILEHTMV